MASKSATLQARLKADLVRVQDQRLQSGWKNGNHSCASARFACMFESAAFDGGLRGVRRFSEAAIVALAAFRSCSAYLVCPPWFCRGFFIALEQGGPSALCEPSGRREGADRDRLE